MALLASVLVLADGGHMHGWDGGWWIVMALGMILFWALVVAGIVWIVREVGGHRHGGVGKTPMEVLDERVARGEISVEEYEARRTVLSGGTSASPG